jgi:hypothetical protein
MRVTQKEVAQLHNLGRVASFIEFGPGRKLFYLLEASLQAVAVAADFDGQSIRVTVPADLMAQWTESDQVGIEVPPRAGVQILIEKDFQCLHGAGEREPDAYPNPLASVETC